MGVDAEKLTFSDTYDIVDIVLFATVDSYTSLMLNSLHYRSILH